jgi:hypothetical protein
MIKQLKRLINSQRTAIFILLILNLLQLRELGILRIQLIDLESKVAYLQEYAKNNENRSIQ